MLIKHGIHKMVMDKKVLDKKVPDKKVLDNKLLGKKVVPDKTIQTDRLPFPKTRHGSLYSFVSLFLSRHYL